MKGSTAELYSRFFNANAFGQVEKLLRRGVAAPSYQRIIYDSTALIGSLSAEMAHRLSAVLSHIVLFQGVDAPASGWFSMISTSAKALLPRSMPAKPT